MLIVVTTIVSYEAAPCDGEFHCARYDCAYVSLKCRNSTSICSGTPRFEVDNIPVILGRAKRGHFFHTRDTLATLLFPDKGKPISIIANEALLARSWRRSPKKVST